MSNNDDKKSDNSSPRHSSSDSTDRETIELNTKALDELKNTLIDIFRKKYCPESNGCCGWTRVLYMRRHHFQRTESLIEAIKEANHFETVNDLITKQLSLFDNIKDDAFIKNHFVNITDEINSAFLELYELVKQDNIIDIELNSENIIQFKNKIEEIFNKVYYDKHPELQDYPYPSFTDSAAEKIKNTAYILLQEKHLSTHELLQNFSDEIAIQIKSTLKNINNLPNTDHLYAVPKHIHPLKNKTLGGFYHALSNANQLVRDIENQHLTQSKTLPFI